MKTLILLGAFAIFSIFAKGATVVITNVSFAFSPDDVTINFGDVIDFQLASIHNAIEVSESTWLDNMNTPLPGFSVPLGGGEVTGLTPGIHYYVCGPHASGGMKGKITVNSASGIGDKESGSQIFSLNPNPSTGTFIFQLKEDGLNSLIKTGNDKPIRIEISDILGQAVYSMDLINPAVPLKIDINTVPDGIYFVRITDNKKVYTRKLVKH